MTTPTNWPSDADGDVLRRLHAKSFDFSSEHEVDFNIDFEEWPPSPEAIAWLESRYSNVKVHQDEAGISGYIQLRIRARVTYEFVVKTQREVTLGTHEYRGICESWGVLYQVQ